MSLYGEMRRSFEAEILDSGGQQPEMLARVHRALSLTHSLLGNHGAILRALRRDGQAVQRVLDIGCGSAAAGALGGGVPDSQAGRRAGGSAASRRGRMRLPGAPPAR